MEYPRREQAAREGVERVDARDGEEVARAALEHGYVGGFVGEVGQEGDGCGAGADDDDLLVGVVEVFGPELRVHHGAFVGVEAGDAGGEGFGVVVVSRAEEEEARVEVLLLAVCVYEDLPRLLVG